MSSSFLQIFIFDQYKGNIERNWKKTPTSTTVNPLIIKVAVKQRTERELKLIFAEPRMHTGSWGIKESEV